MPHYSTGLRPGGGRCAIIKPVKEVPRKPKPEKGKAKEKEDQPLIATNHEAGRDYFIIETVEAGIALVGCEVKSLRSARTSLAGSFARFEKNELFLYNLYIAPYEMGNRENPDPRRNRKLLLHRRELDRLAAKVQEKGLALVPLKMYFHHGIAKVLIGLVKGKRHEDRREDIKKRDIRREMDRALKARNK